MGITVSFTLLSLQNNDELWSQILSRPYIYCQLQITFISRNLLAVYKVALLKIQKGKQLCDIIWTLDFSND